MIICETEFERPDREDPNFSQAEVDYYGHIPYGSDFQQHRLSLRKNLKTGKFEIYRCYQRAFLSSRSGVTILGQKEVGRTEVVFTGSLQEAVDFANKETDRFWLKVHEEKHNDTVCDHQKNIASFCRIAREAYEKKFGRRDNNDK